MIDFPLTQLIVILIRVNSLFMAAHNKVNHFLVSQRNNYTTPHNNSLIKKSIISTNNFINASPLSVITIKQPLTLHEHTHNQSNKLVDTHL